MQLVWGKNKECSTVLWIEISSHTQNIFEIWRFYFKWATFFRIVVSYTICTEECREFEGTTTFGAGMQRLLAHHHNKITKIVWCFEIMCITLNRMYCVSCCEESENLCQIIFSPKLTFIVRLGYLVGNAHYVPISFLALKILNQKRNWHKPKKPHLPISLTDLSGPMKERNHAIINQNGKGNRAAELKIRNGHPERGLVKG